ncbi:VOC family protein [Cupriavidus oxalaticus]|uniref:VOC family protein n=3 Tax=Cupriavidus oxalaticus TaxID=96344 RepID=A0ABX7HYZ9_9BURK|nr:VOC family protein [Cupriavidus oxalaticus]QRQ85944.1 VOC family protein [Cupriavidus oxalaticus]QRQ95730.1 VOC family protein [Cupriavidus oxalaticus]WQD84398.1 VOC family protein [Cupriavidus oxalaticus]
MRNLQASLDHLSIGSPDPGSLASFYANALHLSVAAREGGAFECTGRERRVLIVPGAKGTLNFVALNLPSRQALREFRARLAEEGVAIETAPPSLFGGEAFSIVDPDGNRLVFGHATREDTGDGMKARLQHFAIGTTDIDRALAFYQQVVGLRTSDVVCSDDGRVRTAFLRAGDEHHIIAVFLAPKKSFDHHCYEAGDWALIRDWADHFGTLDIPLDWGPGRHGPGNNLFIMIRDPDRNWLEISAELEVVPDFKPAGKWEHCQKTGNFWGVAYLRS